MFYSLAGDLVLLIHLLLNKSGHSIELHLSIDWLASMPVALLYWLVVASAPMP